MSDLPQVIPPAMAGTSPKPTPEGWWSMSGDKFDGSRAGVLANIAAAIGVPDEDKAYISAKIQKMPPEFNYVVVRAFECGDKSADGKQINVKDDYGIIGYVTV